MAGPADYESGPHEVGDITNITSPIICFATGGAARQKRPDPTPRMIEADDANL